MCVSTVLTAGGCVGHSLPEKNARKFMRLRRLVVLPQSFWSAVLYVAAGERDSPTALSDARHRVCNRSGNSVDATGGHHTASWFAVRKSWSAIACAACRVLAAHDDRHLAVVATHIRGLSAYTTVQCRSIMVLIGQALLPHGDLGVGHRLANVDVHLHTGTLFGLTKTRHRDRLGKLGESQQKSSASLFVKNKASECTSQLQPRVCVTTKTWRLVRPLQLLCVSAC